MTKNLFKFIGIVCLFLAAVVFISFMLEEKGASSDEPQGNFKTSTEVLWDEHVVTVEHDGHMFVVIGTTDMRGGLGIEHHPECSCNER